LDHDELSLEIMLARFASMADCAHA
jgi:hypothetical protein